MKERVKVIQWTPENVRSWLKSINFLDMISKSIEEYELDHLDGEILLSIGEHELMNDLKLNNGISSKKFIRELNKLKRNADYSHFDLIHTGEIPSLRQEDINRRRSTLKGSNGGLQQQQRSSLITENIADFLEAKVGSYYRSFTYNFLKADLDLELMGRIDIPELDEILEYDIKIKCRVHRRRICDAVCKYFQKDPEEQDQNNDGELVVVAEEQQLRNDDILRDNKTNDFKSTESSQNSEVEATSSSSPTTKFIEPSDHIRITYCEDQHGLAELASLISMNINKRGDVRCVEVTGMNLVSNGSTSETEHEIKVAAYCTVLLIRPFFDENEVQQTRKHNKHAEADLKVVSEYNEDEEEIIGQLCDISIHITTEMERCKSFFAEPKNSVIILLDGFSGLTDTEIIRTSPPPLQCLLKRANVMRWVHDYQDACINKIECSISRNVQLVDDESSSLVCTSTSPLTTQMMTPSKNHESGPFTVRLGTLNTIPHSVTSNLRGKRLSISAGSTPPPYITLPVLGESPSLNASDLGRRLSMISSIYQFNSRRRKNNLFHHIGPTHLLMNRAHESDIHLPSVNNTKQVKDVMGMSLNERRSSVGMIFPRLNS